MTINLNDQSSHPLAKDFYDLMGKIAQLGASEAITDCESTLSELQGKVQQLLNQTERLVERFDDLNDLVTTETDTGPVFNLGFLSSAENERRFIELMSGY